MHFLETEGILFDLDGVLVDSTPCVTRVWTAWAVERGYDPVAVVKIAHGRRAIETVQMVAPHLDSASELKELERREIADTEGLGVIEGAPGLLRSVPADRWTIVTSGTRALAITRLRVAGLPVPANLVTADDVALGKPDPAPYLRGAELLGLTPADCLVVEDAPSGIRAAKAAGMRSLALPTTYPADALGEADVLLRALSQVRVDARNGGKLTVTW